MKFLEKLPNKKRGPSKETPPPKRTAKTAQDAARFTDLATPGQEGVDPPGKVGSAKPAPQPSAHRGLARVLPPTATARIPRRRPSTSNSRAFGTASVAPRRPHNPAREATQRQQGRRSPSASPSAATQLRLAQRLQPSLRSSRDKNAPPRPRHPRPFPRPGPRSLTPNPTSTSLEIATPTPGD